MMRPISSRAPVPTGVNLVGRAPGLLQGVLPPQQLTKERLAPRSKPEPLAIPGGRRVGDAGAAPPGLPPARGWLGIPAERH